MVISTRVSLATSLLPNPTQGVLVPRFCGASNEGIVLKSPPGIAALFGEHREHLISHQVDRLCHRVYIDARLGRFDAADRIARTSAGTRGLVESAI